MFHRSKHSFIRDRVLGFVIYIIISDQQTPEAELEILDINLTKESSPLLHAIHSTFYWWILKKTILFSDFINPSKKSAKQENSSLFMNSIFVEQKNEDRKPDKNSEYDIF
jgi:hypothetical protein